MDFIIKKPIFAVKRYCFSMKHPKRGILSPETTLTFDYNEIIDYQTRIEPAYYFTATNHHLPNVLVYSEQLKFEELFTGLVEKYKLTQEHIWTYSVYHRNDKKMVLDLFMLQIQPNLIVYGYNSDDEVKILYDAEVPETILQALEDFILSCVKEVLTKAESKIFLLYESRGLCLQDFQVRRYDIDLAENYNDDFAPIHENIIKRLNTLNDKGIVFLHGTPGTGKTSYIRYLTSLINKKMIYISPEFAHKIGSPDFLPLLIDNSNSILIIEDAENLIEERENSRNVSVSNLLNIADGLLSDCLSIQVICTFNTHISKIDKALLRKGRLIASYEFTALTVEKAQHLSNKLGFTHTIEQPMTLTDIYNQLESNLETKEPKKIGFQ